MIYIYAADSLLIKDKERDFIACFVLLQAVTLKEYPAELSLTALICGMGSLQGTMLTFAVERGNFAIWSVHWDTKFITALYSVRIHISIEGVIR